jgi:hypothetical protein
MGMGIVQMGKGHIECGSLSATSCEKNYKNSKSDFKQMHGYAHSSLLEVCFACEKPDVIAAYLPWRVIKFFLTVL